MLTVDILDQAVATLRELGITTRWEWLSGDGGGECEFGGKRWLFLDLAQTPGEQLEQALTCLRSHPHFDERLLTADLQTVFTLRKSA